MTNRATYSVVDIASGKEGPGFEIRRRRADCTGGPPCLLHNGCRFSLPMVNRPEHGTGQPPSSSVGIKYILYLYITSYMFRPMRAIFGSSLYTLYFLRLWLMASDGVKGWLQARPVVSSKIKATCSSRWSAGFVRNVGPRPLPGVGLVVQK